MSLCSRLIVAALCGALVVGSAGCAKEHELTGREAQRKAAPKHPRPPCRLDEDAASFDRVPRQAPEDGRHLPLPITPREHPALFGAIDGSVSEGTVTTGTLFNGAELPLDGEHHRVMTVQRERGTNFGATELVDAVLTAADAVAKRYPGSVLYVGNMAKGGGGDIPWSVSHNNGRDVDLAFYLVGTDGRQVDLDDLVQLGTDGCPTGLLAPSCKFDVRRNWALVESLISNETIELQYIFVSNALRELLLDHARSRKAPRALVERAAALLHQPMGALPHDDHFHVRIYCPKTDVAEGCVDVGRVRPGVTIDRSERDRRVPELAKMLTAKDPARRAGAARLLSILAARETAPAIAKRLSDKDPEVRLQTLRALVHLGAVDQLERIQRRVAREKDGRVIRAALTALAALGTSRGQNALIELVGDTRAFEAPLGLSTERFTVRARAATLLARKAVRRAVPTIVAALSDPDPDTVACLEHALSLLTNHTTQEIAAALPASGGGQGGADEPEQPPTPEDAWTAWLTAHGSESPIAWLLDGFRNEGYTVEALDARAVPVLVSAIADDQDHISFNAQRGLISIAGTDPGSLDWSREDAHTHWQRWAERNRRMLEKECKRLEKKANKKRRRR